MCLEIAIAVGLGAWFTLAGVCAYAAVSKSFMNIDSEEER